MFLISHIRKKAEQIVNSLQVQMVSSPKVLLSGWTQTQGVVYARWLVGGGLIMDRCSCRANEHTYQIQKEWQKEKEICRRIRMFYTRCFYFLLYHIDTLQTDQTYMVRCTLHTFVHLLVQTYLIVLHARGMCFRSTWPA